MSDKQTIADIAQTIGNDWDKRTNNRIINLKIRTLFSKWKTDIDAAYLHECPSKNRWLATLLIGELSETINFGKNGYSDLVKLARSAKVEYI